MKRDFLTIADLSPDELTALIARAAELKALRARGATPPSLRGKTIALIFEKASTRTRVSFEVAAFELGGLAVILDASGSQVGRGEPARDTARVLSRYCHAVVVRTFAHATAVELARYATVPVVNGLTDAHHPCQVLADLAAVAERFGGIDALCRLRCAWIGDGNNVATSWIEAAGLLGLDLRVACPAGYEPPAAALAGARDRATIELVRDPERAARGAHVLVTDVWASMGQEAEREARARAFAGYSVDSRLLALAAPDCVVLHCLPAHRGEEISDEALEGPRSAVFDAAEYRLHSQKALLELLLRG